MRETFQMVYCMMIISDLSSMLLSLPDTESGVSGGGDGFVGRVELDVISIAMKLYSTV